MNIPSPQNMNGGFGGNGFADIIKSQMLTMTMISSMNGNGNANSNQNIFALLYIFIITQVIEFLTKNMPGVAKKLYDHYMEKMSKTQLLKDFSIEPSKNKTKTSSITILVNIADHENIVGQSLLDYITNSVNTKHISYQKQNFVLNQNDIIEIYDEIFIILKENKTTETPDKKMDVEQCVELFSYTKSMQELRTFLNKVTHEYKIKIQNKLGDKIYFFNQHPTNAPQGPDGKKDYSKLPNSSIFTMKEFQTNRKFTNLFGPEISVVRKRVEFFMKNRKWYDSKGIPYTLGLLLSGQAGAGKTSTIKCLANETKRHIINLNLNNDITKTQLENLFFNEMIIVLNVSTGQSEKYFIPLDQRVYVLEDIDCQSDLVMERSLKNAISDLEDAPKTPEFAVNIETNPGRKTNEKEQSLLHNAEKIDLSFLLNLLDGVLENPGRIVIMTSNFPKLLDHALIRPGRIDVIADFKKCCSITLIEMIDFFYDISLTDDEKNEIMNLKEHIISPAEMGKLMFENFYDYKRVIVKLQELSFQEIKQDEIDLLTQASQNVINEISIPIENINGLQLTPAHLVSNDSIEYSYETKSDHKPEIDITRWNKIADELKLANPHASKIAIQDMTQIKYDRTIKPPELDSESSKPDYFNDCSPWQSSSFSAF
jgi:DNA polymerase III delta prime subunit